MKKQKKRIQTDHNYILIMAGGYGTRLYPRSTEQLPKQFQKIIGNDSLITETYKRVVSVVDKNNIYVSSNKKYTKLIKKHLPKIPKKNYIFEPVKKNTGPAMALATALIYKKDKNAIIIATHSDHMVLKKDEYKKGVLSGVSVIKKNSNNILCVGIYPTVPHTGYGYIEKKEVFENVNKNHIVYTTHRFVEKPNLEKAKKYLSSGNFFWNTGYFIWQAKHFLDELKKYSPDIYKGVMKITRAYGKKNYNKILKEEFSKIESIAVDHMIMEKTKNLLVLPLDLGWSDIGSWDAVSSLLKQKKDEDGNYGEGNIIHIDTHNTAVFSHNKKQIIATMGLDNFIIITSEEAIVIVPKGRSEEVKKIVKKLKKYKN